MKNRSFFVAGALLLASLFTTSCKEFMSNLDEPVKSYLSAPADITVPTGDTYDLSKDVGTINSDKAVAYVSSDDKVVTVDDNGLVIGVADGEATITVSVAASDNYQADSKEVKVAVKRPLTFEALEDGNIDVWFHDAVLDKPIAYSVNGDAKQEITTDRNIPVKKGDKIEFWSANERLTQWNWNWGVQIHPQSQCAVYGNVMSMITPDGNYHTNKTITKDFALYGLLCGSYYWDPETEKYVYFTVAHDKYKLLLPATTLTRGCYLSMLQETGFTEAPELPATELVPYCYQYMFQECRNLTKAPKLSATTMKEGCYGYMFQYCSALEEAPVLPATTLAPWCYQNMFASCSKLENAPALLVTKLAERCYENMFSNTALKEIPALPATKLEPYCYRGMFQGCQSLDKTPILPATELADYCYQNMFQSTSLKVVPALPATNLAVGCYSYMFANSWGLGGSIVLPAEELPAECYQEMFSWCRKLEKVECRATSMTGNNALTNWLNAAGTELETNSVFVRAEANNKWKNKDGWAVSKTPNDWYIPTNWTIEPPITEYERTYTDGPFPFWSFGCTPPVINGAIHYEPNGNWNQFMCVDYGEFPLTAGNYVYVLDLQSDKDADGIVFNVLSGWGTGDQNITVSVPVKAGRKKYELDFSGILGDHEGKYYSILRPGTVDATLDLYSVTIKRVLE
jgi:hypothetical protein